MSKDFKATKVFPIRGLFGVGFAATEHDVDSQEELDAHLATGAFSLSAKEAEEASPWHPDAVQGPPAAAPEAAPAPESEAAAAQPEGE